MKINKPNWKLNKKYLWLRILTFPLKLAFTILWGLLLSLMQSARWLICGSQELLYGSDGVGSLVKIIEQNEKIIKRLNIKGCNKCHKDNRF